MRVFVMDSQIFAVNGEPFKWNSFGQIIYIFIIKAKFLLIKDNIVNP